MKIISRSIIFEIVPLFLLANFFFVFLMLLEQMIQLADLMFLHSVPTLIILKIVVYYLPSFLVLTIPISTLLASLLAFSRFSADSEIVAMYACGASKFTLAKPTAVFGVVVAIFGIYISTTLLPRGSSLAVTTLNEMLQNLSINDINEREMYYDIPGIVFYADKKRSNSDYERIIVVSTKDNAVISARTAEIVPNKNRSVVMKFNDGKLALENKKEEGYTSVDFGSLALNLPLNIEVSSLPVNERLMDMSQLKQNFTKNPLYIFEFHKRFSLPVSSVFMALFGLSLGVYLSRSGRSLGLILASVITLSYNVLFIIVANFVDKYNPVLLAWLPTVLLGLILAFVMKRTYL